MVFSSSIFLLYFFPVFLLVYFITPIRWKNITALVASVLFYAWGAPVYIFVILGILIADYYLGNRIYESTGQRRKLYLVASIVLNVGFLLYFKYSNFFVENVNEVLSTIGIKNVGWTKVVLPIGISFFTFQEMSYTIDIYRGVHKPLQRFTDYMLFIFMFSHLIAGPIVTYHVLADDLVDRRHKLNNTYRLRGMLQFSIGLAKKVLIANQIGPWADQAFGMDPHNMTTLTAWCGALAYTFQLYFDFSGYSDMAIGIGKMLGFDFPENFDNPYTSQNVTEFWRRWHITLGQWMRSYLYIPLGGNRVSLQRLYFNLWIVFIISGFWHGAEWTFVIWGIYHGLFIVLDRLFLERMLKPIGKFPRIIITFIIVVVGWVFFRAPDAAYAFGFIQRMWSFDGLSLQLTWNNHLIFCLALAAFFSFYGGIRKIHDMQYKWFEPDPVGWLLPKMIVAVCLMILCISEIVSSHFNPFIYFRF